MMTYSLDRELQTNEMYRDTTRREVVRVRAFTDHVVEIDRYGGLIEYLTMAEFRRDYEPMYRRYGRYT